MILTIAEAARQFRDGSLTPEKLTEDLLARIEVENPRLNAFYEVFTDEARAQAAQATRELREGRDRGPLHGIPIAVKDLFDVAGHVTTAGAHPGFHPPPAKEDAEVVARLRRAGAVFLGKSALHEWALGVSSNNPHFGPTRNPHDISRIPGGSSGGSAAALAAGLCLGALGTDTGGSIRIPAALCGVVGLKPTFGLVSVRGVAPLSRSLDHAGPMANTVEDVFLLLEAISDFRRVPVKRPRILADPGDPMGAWDANTTILLSEAAELHAERLAHHPEWFGGTLAQRLRGGQEYTAAQVARAREVQREWRAFLERLLGDDAVLELPATPVPATPIGENEGVALSKIMTRYTALFNLAGVPVLCVPRGTSGGLPMGTQLVAAPGRESLLYAAAAAEDHRAT